jgi:hypothetical protein
MIVSVPIWNLPSICQTRSPCRRGGEHRDTERGRRADASIESSRSWSGDLSAEVPRVRRAADAAVRITHAPPPLLSKGGEGYVNLRNAFFSPGVISPALLAGMALGTRTI